MGSVYKNDAFMEKNFVKYGLNYVDWIWLGRFFLHEITNQRSHENTRLKVDYLEFLNSKKSICIHIIIMDRANSGAIKVNSMQKNFYSNACSKITKYPRNIKHKICFEKSALQLQCIPIFLIDKLTINPINAQWILLQFYRTFNIFNILSQLLAIYNFVNSFNKSVMKKRIKNQFEKKISGSCS